MEVKVKPTRAHPAESEIRWYTMRTMPVALIERCRLVAALRGRGATIEAVVVEALELGLPTVEEAAGVQR